MAIALSAVEVHDAPRFAALSPLLRTAPLGFAWAQGMLPTGPTSGRVLMWLVLVSASVSLIGLFTRVATGLTAGLLLFVLALPQQWGAGVHTHHLWWFSMLLASAPSGDALSVDAWRRTRRLVPSAAPTLAHGVPIRAAWVSIGLIFFFPGLWKWHEKGLGWAVSDTLVNQLHFKWLEYGQVPWLRIDRAPVLLCLGGLAVLLLELALLPLLLWERTRLAAVTAALVFHASTQLFFFISFSSLWACYTVFLPWGRWLSTSRPLPSPPRAAWPTVLIAAAVLSGQVASGALLAENAWPFACYPTFRLDPGPRAPVLIVESVHADGSTHELARRFLEGPNGQREWSSMWALLRAPQAGALMAWSVAHPLDPEATRLRFFRGSRATAPEQWSEPARREGLLLETAVQAP